MRHRRPRRRACPAIAIVAGAVLMMLAGPRLVAALIQLPGDHVVRFIENRREVSDYALERLAASRRGALGWVDSGRSWIELGLAQLESARAGRDDRDRLLQRAVAALRRGLARAPADGRGWVWLAEAEWMQGGATPAAVQALRMSIYTDPFVLGNQIKRLDLALAMWTDLDAATREAVIEQVRMADRRYAYHVNTLLAQVPRYGAIVDRIRQDKPERSPL